MSSKTKKRSTRRAEKAAPMTDIMTKKTLAEVARKLAAVFGLKEVDLSDEALASLAKYVQEARS